MFSTVDRSALTKTKRTTPVEKPYKNYSAITKMREKFTNYVFMVRGNLIGTQIHGRQHIVGRQGQQTVIKKKNIASR